MNTNALNEQYQGWVKHSCRPFVMVSRSVQAIEVESSLEERHGLRVYTPDRQMFLEIRSNLEKALSIQPTVYRINLPKGWFYVSWLEKVKGGWLPEIIARNLTVKEFASLYAAIASLAGYPNKPYVFRDDHGAIYFQ